MAFLEVALHPNILGKKFDFGVIIVVETYATGFQKRTIHTRRRMDGAIKDFPRVYFVYLNTA